MVKGDFTCQGRLQPAILGVDEVDIVIAVFINGLGVKPEMLRYSARVRRAETAKLKTEGLDFDPQRELGQALPGMRRSKTCRGLNLSDGDSDSAHIYWNHDAREFNEWSL